MKGPKRIHQNSLTGQQGVNLIATIVGEMGFLWTPTGGSADAGIDGFIEIRQPDTGEATNLIVQVQSKATVNRWDNETETTFEYRCNERDIDYWMQGNAPVILVVSRPRDHEAYWVSVKHYFEDLDRRKSKKVTFDKVRNLFSTATGDDLCRIAASEASGIYLAPPPIQESLISNLLPVARFAQTIFVASTAHRRNETVWADMKERGAKHGKAWFLKDGSIVSFHDLRSSPWKEICEPGTTESLYSDEWARSHDPVKKADFTRLLNLSLGDMLNAKFVNYWHPKGREPLYYFSKTRDLQAKQVSWKRIKESKRTVFGPHFGKKDTTRIIYYRHLAFVPYFLRFGGQWYLEITPSYHFTSDGKVPSKFRESYLAGIKRIEKHESVRGNVEFWASFLTEQDLFSTAPLLTFAELMSFTTDFGIAEKDWLNRADEDEKQIDDDANSTLVLQ
jgi:hypothetical protein